MKKIPILPLSVLIFYLLTILLWNLRIIPSPKQIFEMLEKLLQRYEMFGLILATFLEGIAYVCLYVPGAFIIALTVFISDRSFTSLLTISVVVSITLTIAAFVNYYIGRYIGTRKFRDKKDIVKESEMLSRGFITSMLHPNLLAYYFFNSGLERKNFKQVFYIPLFMIPYGLLFAYMLSIFSGPIREGLESPTLLLTIIVIWFLFAYWKENKKRGSVKKENPTI
jgi:uncharacterized membrane protein YdjX (TVP38/TMEM64 family)